MLPGGSTALSHHYNYTHCFFQDRTSKGVIIEQLSRKKHNVALDFSLNPRTLPEGMRDPKINYFY